MARATNDTEADKETDVDVQAGETTDMEKADDDGFRRPTDHIQHKQQAKKRAARSSPMCCKILNACTALNVISQLEIIFKNPDIIEVVYANIKHKI